MNLKLLLSIIVLSLAIAGLFLVSCQDDWCVMFDWQKLPPRSFVECKERGFSNADTRTYPPTCVAGDKTFTQDVGNEIEKIDLIRINWPRPGGVIKKDAPLRVEGEALGSWFFEASFPIKLKDGNGTVIAEGLAEAEGKWMKDEFIPYAATLSFTHIPATEQGTLVLQKSNPSGMPENDDAFIIPLTFQ